MGGVKDFCPQLSTHYRQTVSSLTYITDQGHWLSFAGPTDERHLIVEHCQSLRGDCVGESGPFIARMVGEDVLLFGY